MRKVLFWGFGISQNYPEAVKWYRKAAEQGYGKLIKIQSTTPCHHTMTGCLRIYTLLAECLNCPD